MERIWISALLMVLLTSVPLGVALAEAPQEVPSVPKISPYDDRTIEDLRPTSGFMENKGQLSRDDILFYSTGNPLMGLGQTSAIVAVFDDEGNGYSYEMLFDGADPSSIVGTDARTGYMNFLRGMGHTSSIIDVMSFDTVRYKDLYPGIDMEYRFGADGAKYDLLVHPGVDPAVIAIDYRSTEGLSIDSNGDLLVRTPLGTLVEESPKAFQGGKDIKVSFRMIGTDRVTFEIGEYDVSELLVIDPLLKQSTFLGGRDDDFTESPPFLYQGDMIVAGTTYSTNFPVTSGVVDPICSQYDVFVTRMSSDLSALVWSTFLGGTENDYGYDLEVDTSGNVFVTGQTDAKDFPTTSGAFDETSNIRTVMDEWGWEYTIPDAFASKIASDGKSLLYSTFIGGKGNDTAKGITVDSSGNAFIGGYTDSSDFPTQDPYQDTMYGYQDGFVLVLDPTGSSLVYSTYLGGYDNYADQIVDIELDSSGKAVVIGYTSASDFPVTTGAYNTVYVYDMPFVTKFLSDGSDLVFSTFLFQDTYVNDMCLYNDEVHITGYTYNSAFPATKDAYSNTMGGWSDAFACILSIDGSKLVYATLLGGSDYESGNHIMVNGQGAMLVSGFTYSTDFPTTKDTYKSTINGYMDAYVTWFTLDRKDLYFSTYFGGSQEEQGYGTVMTGTYEPCLYGTTSSNDLPTTKGSYSPTMNGGYQDVFLAKFKTNSFSPGKPMGLSLVAGNAMLDLSWSPPLHDGNETIVAYTLFRSLNNETFDVLKTMNGDKTNYSDTSVQNGKVYYYYVSATNIVGEGPISNTVSGVPINVPSIPLNFALRKGNGFVDLTWDLPTDNGGDPYVNFNVYSGTDPLALVLSVEDLDGLSYNFTGLENGLSYHFRVNAVTRAGEGPGTVILTAYPSTVPSAPRNLTSTRGDRYIHLYWQAPSYYGGEAEVTYNVFTSTNNVTFGRLGTKLSALDYNVTAIDNGLVFFFRVTAVNVRGEGSISNIIENRAIGAPSEPREVQVTMGDETALVRWMPPNNMGGDLSVVYNVYVGTGVYQMERGASGLSTTEFLVEGLENGILHYFSVSAENSLYEGPLSLFVTGTSMRVPSVPLGLSVVVGDGKLTLSWSSPADIGGDTTVTYEVFFGTTLDSLMLTATTDLPTYHEPGLKNGRTYHAMVRAKNQAGTGPFTDPVSGIPMGKPSAPLSLIVTRGDRSLNVSWTKPLDLGGAGHVNYTIYLSNASRSLFPYARSVEATYYLMTGLTNGVNYQVSVGASNPAGESDLSNSVGSMPMTVPGAPVFELMPGDSEMNITWTLPVNDGGGTISQVRIYRSLEGKEPSFHRMVPASKGAFTDLDLDNGMTYRYSLSCMNEVGEGSRSDIKEATPKAEGEPASISGLLIAGLTLSFLVIAIVIIVLFLMMRKKKAAPAQTGPMAPQVQGMAYDQTGAQLPPGYVQGLPQYP
ncbi:MAG: fibronectin type III domain-containing protein, partial [Candidatus Thermoplasmatota archaeon]|nr:fibronectin type III domain-containing protein [Candidatus Thermoplasmatota archaeon]